MDLNEKVLLAFFFNQTWFCEVYILSTAKKESITPISKIKERTQFIVLHSDDSLFNVSESGIGTEYIKSVLGWK